MSGAPRRARLRVALLASLAGPTVADTGPVAQVGPIAIDAAFFRQRASRVAALAWPEFGASWPEQRRRFLDDVLIDEALLSLAGAAAPAALPSAQDRALARTLDALLVDEASKLEPSEADVRAYRARHGAEFEAPRRLAIWRILLPTQADARAVLAELAPPSLDVFSRLARERSIDGATKMRAGNLGLVAADGQTSVPALRVSPALFAAADRVADGALVPEPVREGDAFAVVWRRTSRAAHARLAAEVAQAIAARLAEQRAAASRQALLDALRREHLAEYHPDAVAEYEPRFPEAGAPPRPSRAPRASGALPRIEPELTERGLR